MNIRGLFQKDHIILLPAETDSKTAQEIYDEACDSNHASLALCGVLFVPTHHRNWLLCRKCKKALRKAAVYDYS